MKHINKITLIFLAVFTVGLVGVQSAFAQKIDEQRMNRDIRVAEKILSTLFKTTNSARFSIQRTSGIQGTYIPNYGVLFRVPQIFYNDINNGVVYMNEGGNKQVLRNRIKVVNIGDYKSGDVVYWLSNESKVIAPVVVGNRTRKRKEVRGIKIDSVINGRRTRALNLIKTFMRDYSSLLSQLADNDKIVVAYDRVLNMRRLFEREPRLNNKNSFMVSVNYKDAKANRGKNLDKKIKVTSLMVAEEDKPQFEVFKKILDELFERKNTDGKSFYRRGRTSYTHLKDFGAIYDLRLRGPRRKNHSRRGYRVFDNDNGTVIINNGGKVKKTEKEMSEKQRLEKREKARVKYNQKLKKAYAKLEIDLKKYMVDYGRTLRKLAANEVLMFNVRLSSSYYASFSFDDDETKKGEKLPKLLVMTIKMSDLNGNNAESKINIKKY